MSKSQVLIVEDSADYRALLKRLFAREGYEVTCAVHGQDALTQLSGDSKLPDLILLDLMMPIMDGFEFRANQLADPRFAPIPVILMTAHGNLEEDSAKMRIDNCLRKPVDMDRLLTLAKNLTSVQ